MVIYLYKRESILPIIVDKVQKKRDIAYSCKELFIENHLRNITILKIAQTAKIAKGSLYDYFKNKEDVVFELIHILIEEHNQNKEQELARVSTIQEKIKIFFKFFYEKESQDLRKLYKEFIAISLTNPSDEIITFQSNYFNYYCEWFERIIKDSIDKKELKPIALELIMGIFAGIEGIFINSCKTNVIRDVEKEIDRYLDAIFQLLEEKK